MTRRAMTLVEMLVALAATLLLMTAIAQAFSAFGSAISDSRAVLDLDGRMRTVAWRLRSDLAGATARPIPPLGPDSGEGYLEIIEGPAEDADAADGTEVAPADHDDALLLTTRSSEVPFTGRAPTPGGALIDQNQFFESTIAEVAWFARRTPGSVDPPMYTLYRKQLLVMGYVATDPFTVANNNRISIPLVVGGTTYIPTLPTMWSRYYGFPCDISARLEVSGAGMFLYPNTLADLTRREARFMHNQLGTTGTAAFPFRFVDHQIASTSGTTEVLPSAVDGLVFDATSQRQGEDIVLTNVIAFDVRVFDPGAAVYITPGQSALVPGDPDYAAAAAGPMLLTGTASGAYVDLGHGAIVNPLLSGIVSSNNAAKFPRFGQALSGLVGTGTTRRTYDTWSRHYEANGLDEDGDGPSDEGTNGDDDDGDGNFDEPARDDDGDGVFNDLGETETLPPYPVALRGIEVRIRCYEPSSRQVRQVTVRHTFVPH